MSCINKLTESITYNCDANKPKAGLETTAVIINKDDLDLQSLVTSGSIVSNITLVEGTTGHKIEWIKQLGNTASEFAPNDAGIDKFSNSFACRVFGQGAEDAERIKELAQGEFVVVVQTKYKGTANADAFKVFGLENGLRMSEGSFTSLENDGSFLFTLSSVEGYGESYPYMVYLESTYAASKAKFDALFA